MRHGCWICEIDLGSPVHTPEFHHFNKYHKEDSQFFFPIAECVTCQKREKSQ